MPGRVGSGRARAEQADTGPPPPGSSTRITLPARARARPLPARCRALSRSDRLKLNSIKCILWVAVSWECVVQQCCCNETQKDRIMTLSKLDAKHLTTILQHAANGNIETFDRLITSWIRSSPSELVLSKRTAAIAAVMARMDETRARMAK